MKVTPIAIFLGVALAGPVSNIKPSKSLLSANLLGTRCIRHFSSNSVADQVVGDISITTRVRNGTTAGMDPTSEESKQSNGTSSGNPLSGSGAEASPGSGTSSASGTQSTSSSKSGSSSQLEDSVSQLFEFLNSLFHLGKSKRDTLSINLKDVLDTCEAQAQAANAISDSAVNNAASQINLCVQEKGLTPAGIELCANQTITDKGLINYYNHLMSCVDLAMNVSAQVSASASISVSKVTSSMSHVGSEATSRASSAVSSAASQASSAINAGASRVSEGLSTATSDVAEIIQDAENALGKALGISIGAGVGAGFRIGGRKTISELEKRQTNDCRKAVVQAAGLNYMERKKAMKAVKSCASVKDSGAAEYDSCITTAALANGIPQAKIDAAEAALANCTDSSKRSIGSQIQARQTDVNASAEANTDQSTTEARDCFRAMITSSSSSSSNERRSRRQLGIVTGVLDNILEDVFGSCDGGESNDTDSSSSSGSSGLSILKNIICTQSSGQADAMTCVSMLPSQDASSVQAFLDTYFSTSTSSDGSE